MSKTARLYRIEQMLQDRGCVTFSDMIEALEVSPATLKRDLAYLRDRLNAPITYDRFTGGYAMGTPQQGERHQLPGLWFSPQEIRALLTMHQLLTEMDVGGLLGPHIQPLMARITALLGSTEASPEAVATRVKLMAASQRRHVPLGCFEAVGNALMMRKRLKFQYHSRHRNEVAVREVSPQRLTHYRENWYLDAWCHTSHGVRMFALDAITQATMMETPAHEVSARKVAAELGEGYGIYNGQTAVWAVLRFTPQSARWVASERWHPKQKTRQLADGSLEIELPYLNPIELIMDILRHGDQVRVISPPELQQAVLARLDAARQQYKT
ncbi:MAG: helix-turn-helix transcriptional regulator [Polaromonas sp.]